jgi:uncharacterized protein involved in outer membrane biogenesis
MKKTLKWTLIILGSLIVLILAAAIILPIVFKDDIKAAIDKEIAKSVNADVHFESFDLSLFRHFPNITAQMNQLGVINREPFAGEVLFATEKFEIEVNLRDILFGDRLRLKGISLVSPVINVIVLKDGRANYDIDVPSTDTVKTEEPSEFSFGIDHWEISDASILYDDRSIPFKMMLKNVDHSGSGDFTQAVFDLKTLTTADTVTVSFDGTEYLTNKRAMIDATISISEDVSKYTFKENKASINDFAMSFNGWFKMNANDFGMDISFKSPDNSFKSLLSLVPGMYSKSFEKIETNGDLSFAGFVKGTSSEKQMPAFNVDLKVKDAMFKYPDLPTAVNNINLDLLLDNKDGIVENTVVDLKKLHLEFGSNPVDARALITKLYPTNVDAAINAKLNLAELGKMFPMEGLEMKGNYAIDLKAKGIYDSLKKIIPAIDANMSLANGYVKSKDFPLPLQDMKFTSNIKNASGKMAETFISVKDFSMLLDGEKINANLLLENLDDYTWDLKVNGGADLEKMTKIFPVEGMTLAGKVKANIITKGKYSDLQAERYERLPTSGTASLKDFKYITKDLPPVAIGQATMIFDPKKINLEKLDGTIGKSDFQVNGSVLNYLGFALGKNETVKGVVNFNSTLLDLNEFMTDTEETATSDTTSGVIAIPQNIDFLLKSNIKTVKMSNLTLTNATGDILVKDGVANLNGLKFNTLGGTVGVNGIYSTVNLKHPTYNLGLKIENMSMREASSASSLIKTYAPIAGLVNGNFSTDFKLDGEIGQDMMPKLSTVNGSGLIKIAQAALKESKLISGITSLTKLDDTNEVTMKDVLMSAAIKDGKLSVKPFDVKFGSYKTTIAGSTNLDGVLDYTLKMDVPAGKLGSQFNGLLSQYSGKKSDPNSTIPVTIGLGGKYDNPSTKLVMDEQKKQVQEAATNAVKEEGTKVIEKAVKGTDAEKVVKDLLGGGKKDTARTRSDTAKTKTILPTTTQEVKKKAEDEAKKKIQNLLKRK